MSQTLHEKMEQKSVPEPNTGCWIWDGATSKNGYWIVRGEEGQTYLAHRAAYFCSTGNWPSPGQDVCHSCDNRWCVNPSHLWVGSRKENMQDCVGKGRLRPGVVRGSKSSFAKIDEATALAIRGFPGSLSATASAFGVSKSLVSLIRRGKVWTHV